ncbi:epoxide hydrolase N-terminal domain-containing protein [Actinotalea ferrariae]|uniref:epoxide hydrolase N-terminal domain-containing protein n=1 Tax=Actinotalea ferrariae TaxID=1386098 RepID=UPI001C8C8784|nr:epoxide hydrolase N-terminal domain-containing protein [Actinotalea ferrariae]
MTQADGDVVVEPFRVRVPDADLDDLRERLRRTRWPAPALEPRWAEGPPLEYLRELCRTWAEDYDWRAAEERLEALGQVRVRLTRMRCPDPDAMRSP